MSVDEKRVGLAFCQDRSAVSYDDPDMVGRLVREAMIEGGLGESDPAIPLADVIEPGMSVLLKPNWVHHCNRGGYGMDCMVTHPSVVEAVLKEVVKAKPGRVIIADAPIQTAEFEALVPPVWQDKLRAIGGSCPVDIMDFRRRIWRNRDGALGGQVEAGLRNEDNYILYDLKEDSLLQEVSTPAGRFRITCYDPALLAKTHRPGCHQYLVSREVFDADVVINLPKLKTHQKAGITASLKNLVGINGDKDYLPHHRLGGAHDGGDCYEGRVILKRIVESLYDSANRRINTFAYKPLAKAGNTFLLVNKLLRGEAQIEGGWHGNDTVWRMVLDLNRLALYGRTDGSLSATPMRRVFSLTDAVIAGEGFGPLYPEPLRLGAMTFASSSAFADLAHTALFRFDWRKIPAVCRAFGDFPYPLVTSAPEEIDLHVNGGVVSMEELAQRWGVPCKPARGWQGHIEY